jgi:hypothetical protein
MRLWLMVLIYSFKVKGITLFTAALAKGYRKCAVEFIAFKAKDIHTRLYDVVNSRKVVVGRDLETNRGINRLFSFQNITAGKISRQLI